MPWIRPATFADALMLADRLRYEDAREIAACWGLGAREGLFHCLMHSERHFALFEDAEPVALWGISSVTDAGLRIGFPWMLATDRLFDGRRAPLHRSRRVVRHLLHEHDVLTNLTDAANHAHLRWLAWCGFRLLRQHECYGASGSPFVEFYQQNPARGLTDDVVRSVLLHRAAPCRPPQNDVVGRLVRIGMAVLDQPAQVNEQHLQALTWVLERLEHTAAVGVALRRGCIRLLLEMAVAVGNGPGGRRPLRHTPIHELMSTLSHVADFLILEGVATGSSLVEALDVREPGSSIKPGKSPPAGARDLHSAGTFGFDWLLRRYVRMLTLDGCLSRSQGFRVWRAALGVDESRAEAPLGIARRRLRDLLADHRLSRSLRGNSTTGESADLASHEYLERPVERGRALAAMRAAVEAGSRLHCAIVTHLEGLVLDSRSPPPQARLRNLGELIFVASAVADRAALQVLPSLRLGGVVSGYADRHALYRLLRARLIVAGSELPMRAVVPLLVEEVVALLTVAGIETRLLMGNGTLTAEETDAVLRDLLGHRSDLGRAKLALGERRSPEIAIPDLCAPQELGVAPSAAGRPSAWLMSPLAVPVRHAAELEPALLVWHLAASGDLAGGLEKLVDVVGDDPLGPRLRYRKFLRRLARDVDIVSFGRHLGLHVDAEPEQTSPRRRVGGP